MAESGFPPDVQEGQGLNLRTTRAFALP